MPEYGTFKATETERVPSAYYVPAELTKAVDNLRAHGVADDAAQDRADRPDRAVHDPDEQPRGRAFEGHNERTLTGTWGAAERELPAGTLRIDMKQPLARLAFYLIEPRSDDGLVDWNLLDEALGESVPAYPIVRTRN